MASHPRNEDGVALVAATVLGLLIGLSAVAALMYSDNVAARLRGQEKVAKAARVAENGIAWTIEEWRRSPGILDFNDGNGDLAATTSAENARIGVEVACAGGTFAITRIENANFGDAQTTPKLIDIRGTYDNMRYAYRALIGPNLVSPIQGSGTRQSQTWQAGSLFTSIGGGGTGTVFANGNVTLGATSGGKTGARIEGDVAVVGNITAGSGSVVTGNRNDAAAAITFPNVAAKIAAKVTEAKGRAASYWSDPQTSLVMNTAITKGETINANPANYGSGWPSQANMKSKSMALVGGNVSLPAGNYAFGRLWLDGTIMTIKAPSGGGTLVLPDIYLTNNARLILDATDGPFTIIQGQNQAFETSTDVGYSTANTSLSTNAWKWNGSSWAQATNGKSGATNPLQITMNGTASANLWYKTGGASSADSGGPKPDRGTGSGYDDWSLRDGGKFITVTPGVGSIGAELWMENAADLVLSNGGQILAGINSASLDALKSGATTDTQIDAMVKNAKGFIAWSGGGSNARLNIDSGAGAGGSGSLFYGMVFGEYDATLGANSEFVGAFVGDNITTAGVMRFDTRLIGIATSEDLNSHHPVVKFRILQ